MGYYHIELIAKSKELCTIITQWGKHKYQQLPMDMWNSPDIFQEKMSDLFVGLDTVRVYIDELLHVTQVFWKEYITVLKEMFTRLQKAGLKVNASKSCFGAHKFDYLGYHVTRDGVMPIPKKVKAIQGLAVPKTRKKLRQFIGMINFYSDMWQKCSEILAPLNALTSKNFKYDWKYEHQKCFDDIKRVIGREVLLAYPDFSAPFEIHTNASKLHIVAVLWQKDKHITFYSRMMNIAQQNYTTTEKELLSIVASLKEFRDILLGHKLTFYTDHKNLTYNF